MDCTLCQWSHCRTKDNVWGRKCYRCRGLPGIFRSLFPRVELTKHFNWFRSWHRPLGNGPLPEPKFTYMVSRVQWFNCNINIGYSRNYRGNSSIKHAYTHIPMKIIRWIWEDILGKYFAENWVSQCQLNCKIIWCYLVNVLDANALLYNVINLNCSASISVAYLSWENPGNEVQKIRWGRSAV